MKLSELVFRSLLKNMKHYYLYFFSLIFSVTLYFSFKTLNYNKEVSANLKDGAMASAGFEVATYLLYFVILVFVLYANSIFMKRRSKELGLYQLIGMTKGLIFRLIAIENIILFSGAVISGIVLGFITSRIFAMILLKLIGESFVLGVAFNWEAVVMTLAVFAVMLVIILLQQLFIIQRSSLLELFKAANKSDESIKKFSWFHMIMGVIGLGMITYGYTASTVMFEGSGESLLMRMLLVLFSTIIGTYLVFRYSVALLINFWRRRKAGYLSSIDIIALMPIMHRMKSSASSLTLISVLTAVSLGVNTLSFISYYTIDKMTENSIPADFISNNDAALEFMGALDQKGIAHEVQTFEAIIIEVDFRELLLNQADAEKIGFDILGNSRVLPASLVGEELTGQDAIVKNFNGYTTQIMDFATNRTLQLSQSETEVRVIAYDETSLLSGGYGLTLYPVLIVADELYNDLLGKGYMTEREYQVNLVNRSDHSEANALYIETEANIREVLPTGDIRYFESKQARMDSQMEGLGLTIFITAFLGLAFLLASGSILYFKQMTEADMEMESYTVLRKIGYSEQDLMKGIYSKQLFNFGVPIIVGLLHSYFAVKSGWWFFGTEFATPIAIMMSIYIVLYILFACLAIRYYRGVVRKSF